MVLRQHQSRRPHLAVDTVCFVSPWNRSHGTLTLTQLVPLTMHPLLDPPTHLRLAHHQPNLAINPAINLPRRKNVLNPDHPTSTTVRATRHTLLKDRVSTVNSLPHLNSRVKSAVSVVCSTRLKPQRLSSSKDTMVRDTEEEDTVNMVGIPSRDTAGIRNRDMVSRV